MASGVFDLIHPGHLFYLSEAKKLGAELIVVVARDSTVKRLKNHYPIVPEKNRLQIVQALKQVDRAILGSKRDIFQTVRKIKPDIIALGPNQSWNEAKLKAELKARGLNAKICRIRKKKEGPFSSTSEIVSHLLTKAKDLK